MHNFTVFAYAVSLTKEISFLFNKCIHIHSRRKYTHCMEIWL